MNSPTISNRSIQSLVLGAAGGALVGARPRRGTPRTIAAIAGLALVGIAAHRPMADALRRAGTRRRSAQIRLSFVVPQSVSTVFHFCSDFANFPRFIGALHEVNDYGDGRSHWVASTPTGGRIEWDTVITKYLTNRVIGWRSTARSPVSVTGTIRFIPEHDGGTCVKVALDYAVIDGKLVDAVASLAVPPRAHEIESDIRRLADTIALADTTSPPAITAS